MPKKSDSLSTTISNTTESTENNENNENEEDEIMYEVEKVLKKRYNAKKRRYEYFLKWKDFPSTHNSWEPAENLTEDLLNEFNERMSDSPKRQESRTSQVGSKRQKRSSLDKTPAGKSKTSDTDESESLEDREPERIVAVKMDDKDELMLLFKWKDSNDLSFVPSKIANLKYPQVVIKYYESIFDWN